jgi:hypothetical protein
VTTLSEAISAFGVQTKARLANPGVRGAPEDQLRTPLDALIGQLALLCGLSPSAITAVGETTLADLATRPDFAITSHNALIGFIEVKAPGKGADPRRFKDAHDAGQWRKLQSLPNLIYTDGNSFSLWRYGEKVEIVHLEGDVESSGAKLTAPPALLRLFDDFFKWIPTAPKTAKQLAETSARLCRFLRDEVTEQLARGNEALTGLAADWRKLLFPDADDATFADGYAQAVTFGLLMARARDISLSHGWHDAAKALGKTSTLIGAALGILTENAGETLKTSLGTLTRVLDVVDWSTISKGQADAWLYFYEDFLEIYDNHLRKQTGSYYTPPEVVEPMIRWVDEVLRSHFDQPDGLASPKVTIADPAVGTGTFVLGVLRAIADIVAKDQGEGAIAGAMVEAIKRIIGFELQLGPYAVAQLRITAELTALGAPAARPRMFVADTLADPAVELESLGSIYKAIGDSLREANRIKLKEPITVVIGNPPYKEKAKGRGGWIEEASSNTKEDSPLDAWFPPREWGAGAHSKHLYNLYIYFWRWATWKIFDQPPGRGVVCFITMAGFLNGPGFQKMRAWLRAQADQIWVVDCSPEGHQPEVPSRIFQGVQQPVCIVLVARSGAKESGQPAKVWFRALPEGHRKGKFDALAQIGLGDGGWMLCPTEDRADFLPAAEGVWPTWPALDDFFADNGSGTMPGRTWVIAPDADSLRQRWRTLIETKDHGEKEELFQPHLGKDKDGHEVLGDHHVGKVVRQGLGSRKARPTPLVKETELAIEPERYGYRSFDRQWIIPDARVINRANPGLWVAHSDQQVYLTALSRTAPSNGPGLSITGSIPDIDHYNARGGRAFSLWADAQATRPNLRAALCATLARHFGFAVTPADVLAWLAAVAAHPAYTAHFQADLARPGLRIPLTKAPALFQEAVNIGRQIIWLHTFGERFVDGAAGRPRKAPRVEAGEAPRMPAEGAIKPDPAHMPDDIDYDPGLRRLKVGQGFIDGVAPEVWAYEVSGKQVVKQWFSYRKANRERPVMGDRRPPSKLNAIQPDHWLAEYTTELLNVLHVLTVLVRLEPQQADLLQRILAGPLFTRAELAEAGAFADNPAPAPAPVEDLPLFGFMNQKPS